MASIEKTFSKSQEHYNDLRRRGVAIAAQYDALADKIVVTLDTGIDIRIPPMLIEGLQEGEPASWNDIVISPAGLGLHWPQLDADVYLPALMQGVWGSASWMARQLGKNGGLSRSDKKTAAAKENGKKGGRPKKTKTAAGQPPEPTTSW